MRVSTLNLGLMLSLAAMLAAGGFAGCAKKPGPLITPAVDTPTEGWGLRKLEPSEYPDMKLAWADRQGLLQAVDKSLQFLQAPSSKNWYPSKNPGDTITHDQVQQTLEDIKDMIARNVSASEFQATILSRYDVYTSIGYDNQGDVWFTGYFTPIYDGSLKQTAEFRYPIYSRPADLQTDVSSGAVMGGSYPTRKELTESGKLKGLELLWFRKPLEPFMIQVQGSAEVKLSDGTVVKVGYAGSNDRKHTGLGTLLRDEGKIDPKHVSLPAVMAYYDQHPDELAGDVMKDDRFTFQKIYTTEAELREWPTGSINVQVTPGRSLATDKDVFPRAALTFINVDKPTMSGAVLPYEGFLLDQDRGGAIRAAGRADIYFGVGSSAGTQAGEEFAQGRLYYIFLKPQYVKAMASVSAPRALPVSRTGAASAAPRGTSATIATPRASATPAQPSGDMFPGAVRPK